MNPRLAAVLSALTLGTPALACDPVVTPTVTPGAGVGAYQRSLIQQSYSSYGTGAGCYGAAAAPGVGCYGGGAIMPGVGAAPVDPGYSVPAYGAGVGCGAGVGLSPGYGTLPAYGLGAGYAPSYATTLPAYGVGAGYGVGYGVGAAFAPAYGVGAYRGFGVARGFGVGYAPGFAVVRAPVVAAYAPVVGVGVGFAPVVGVGVGVGGRGHFRQVTRVRGRF